MKKYIEYETGRFSEADEIKKATARIDWKRQSLQALVPDMGGP